MKASRSLAWESVRLSNENRGFPVSLSSAGVVAGTLPGYGVYAVRALDAGRRCRDR